MFLKLKFLLLRNGLSQRELARQLRTSPSHVSRLIHRHDAPRRGERRQISRLLRVPVKKLFPEIGRLRSRREKKEERSRDRG